MPEAENLVELLPTISPVAAAATATADDIMKQNIETRRHSPRNKSAKKVRETGGTRERLRFRLSGDNIDFRRAFLRNGR